MDEQPKTSPGQRSQRKLLRAYLAAALLLIVGRPSLADDPRITAIDPPELGFFSKQVICRCIPIKAHRDVSDAALREAFRRLNRQLAGVPDVVANLVDAGAELHIIGKNQVTSDLPYLRHWKGKPYDSYDKTFQSIDERTRGIGGLLSSCGEENLLRLDSDRYRDHRDICSHEFAHCLFDYGFSPDVRDLVVRQYKKSLAAGLWKTAYAATNANEFFAELTMWYFGSRGDYGQLMPPPQLGRDWLKQYDPEAFALLDGIYSGQTKVARITWEKIAATPAGEEGKLRSLNSDHTTTLVLDNRTLKDYALFWLDFDGKRKPYGTLHAGESALEHTFATHPWLLAESNGRVVAIYVAGKLPGRAVVR